MATTITRSTSVLAATIQALTRSEVPTGSQAENAGITNKVNNAAVVKKGRISSRNKQSAPTAGGSAVIGRRKCRHKKMTNRVVTPQQTKPTVRQSAVKTI